MMNRHEHRRDGGRCGDPFARRDLDASANNEAVAHDEQAARNGEPDIAAEVHIGAACGSTHVDISARFRANLRWLLVVLDRIWRGGGEDG